MKNPRSKKRAVTGTSSSLSSLEFFQGVPAASLRAIEKESVILEVPAEHVFFRPGETGCGVFILEKGNVQTYRTSGDKKLIIAQLRPPALFGEMGCVGPCLYHCFAQATRPSRVRCVSQARVQVLLQQYPAVTRRLLDLVTERFVQVLLDLEETSFRHLIPRLANRLLQLAESDSIRGLTHKEIAEYLHVYRESTTAALGELRKAGIIAIERKQIRILDRPRLERAARE